MIKKPGLLIKVQGDRTVLEGNRAFGLSADALEPILTLPPASSGTMGVAADAGATWLRAEPAAREFDNPWDDAHAIIDRNVGFAVDGTPSVLVAEPDMEKEWIYGEGEAGLGMAANALKACVYDPPSEKGGVPEAPKDVAWNAGPGFSQLAAARKKVDAKQQVEILIAHLDTGIDPKHLTCPTGLVDKALWRNFVRDGHGPHGCGRPCAHRHADCQLRPWYRHACSCRWQPS